MNLLDAVQLTWAALNSLGLLALAHAAARRRQRLQKVETRMDNIERLQQQSLATLEQIGRQVSALATRRDMEDAVERVLSRRRRPPAPTTRFYGTTTVHGPTVGGDISDLDIGPGA